MKGAKDKKGRRRLVIRYRYLNDYVDIPIKPKGSKNTVKIDPGKWNPSTRSVKKSHPGHTHINAVIRDSVSRLQEVYFSASRGGDEPIPKSIKSLLEGGERKGGFWPWMDIYMQIKKGRIAKTTFSNYIVLYNLMRSYSILIRPITFSSINVRFVDDFVGFLFKKGQKNSTVRKNINILKTILSAAEKDRFITRNGWESYEVTVGEISKIILRREEIVRLEEMQLSGDELVVRDIFLLCLYGCLRVSEVGRIKPEDIEGDVITYYMTKVKRWNKKALPHKAISIIERYNFRFPQEMFKRNRRRNYINEKLRIICKLAGMDEPYTDTRLQGFEIVDTTKPRWEWVGTHTARRTAITLMEESGVSLSSLQRYAGHSNMATTKKYVHADEQVAMDAIRDFW